MTETEKLEKLKKKIEEARERLFNASKETVLEDFMRVYSLNEVYDAITGKDIFTIVQFVEHDEDMAMYLVGELNSKKNDLIRDERAKTASQLAFQNPILTDMASGLNNYYKDLTSGIILPEGNYRRDYLDRRIINLPERHISNEKIGEIITEFIGEVNPEHKNLFNEMNADGRIFLLDNRIKKIGNFGGGFNGANFDYNNVDDCIVVQACANDLEKISIIAHEIAHEIELMNLRKNASHDEFLDYRLRSQYAEMKSTTYGFMVYDFLQKQGYPEAELKSLRTYELLKARNIANMMIGNVFDSNKNYLENYNHDLEYTYGFLTSIYLNGLDNKEEFNKCMTEFDRNKVNLHDLEILNKIGCNSDNFNKSLVKCIKRCK